MTRAGDDPRPFTIDRPGIYELPMEVYHGYRGEPCVAPSISSSGLRQMIDCPAEYWWNSPLNPNRPRVDEPVQELCRCGGLTKARCVAKQYPTLKDDSDWLCHEAMEVFD